MKHTSRSVHPTLRRPCAASATPTVRRVGHTLSAGRAIATWEMRERHVLAESRLATQPGPGSALRRHNNARPQLGSCQWGVPTAGHSPLARGRMTVARGGRRSVTGKFCSPRKGSARLYEVKLLETQRSLLGVEVSLNIGYNISRSFS